MCTPASVRHHLLKTILAVTLAASSAGCSNAPVAAGEDFAKELPPGGLRVATFNASMHRDAAGELIDDLATETDEQARATAEIIQRIRPDVLLLQEFDWDADGEAVALFAEHYLGVSQNGQDPIAFEHHIAPEVNIGIPTGFDLDNDGEDDGPGDALGFGEYEGKYAFVILSRYPIDHDAVRTFRNFLWRDMPDVVMPKHSNGQPWYRAEERDVLSLSSKTHIDVPIDVNGERVHVLAHHPTPPAFDGPEDRNGLRNFAEIRFWADYISPASSDYIVDDAGVAGGLADGEAFFILGDHNADPHDGSGVPGAIDQLLEHPRVGLTMIPASAGGREAAVEQGGQNGDHEGNPAYDTGDFHDGALGNLRLDYVLPSAGLGMLDAQVFWPTSDSALAPLIEHSDHRAVWIDVMVSGGVAHHPTERQTFAGTCPTEDVGVVFVDADSTLRVSKSGAPTANTPDDVYVLPLAAEHLAAFHRQGYVTAIVSNQGGVAGGHTSLEAAVGGVVTIARLLAAQGAPIDYLDIAEAYDEYRKPDVGMATMFEQVLWDTCGVGIDWDRTQMIGDAGYKRNVDGPHPDGRPADDFSNSDRGFAENLGIPFAEPTDAWGWRAFEIYNVHDKDELLALYDAIAEELAELEGSGDDPDRVALLTSALASRALNEL